ncbi:hypothetical protein P3S68_012979 [Capsicum galapagoense]
MVTYSTNNTKSSFTISIAVYPLPYFPMDSGGRGGANNLRYHRKQPYSDRILGVLSTVNLLSQPSTSTSVAGDELTEHDIFDVSSNVVLKSTVSTSISPKANLHRSPNHRNSNHKHYGFGILAALPESEAHAQAALLSVSSSSSSSSTSSARLIPTIPKRLPVDRVRYLQSAPVNVPVMSAAAAAKRISLHFDDVDDNEEDGGGEMLPPHEFVASKQTAIMVSSVFEGAGRKLKGRDLRQVRDSIWQKTVKEEKKRTS